MTKSVVFLFAISTLILTSSCQKREVLFQEKTKDWIKEGDASWAFINGALEGSITEGNGFVMTQKTYKDFELTLEFHPDSTINSGVFLRCKTLNIDAKDCHEINIWDLHPNQEFRTGSIVTKAVPLAKVSTLNQWNTYRIRNQGDQISVWVNDTLTANHVDTSLEEGHIGLQAAGKGKIKFRNIFLESLE